MIEKIIEAIGFTILNISILYFIFTTIKNLCLVLFLTLPQTSEISRFIDGSDLNVYNAITDKYLYILSISIILTSIFI